MQLMVGGVKSAERLEPRWVESEQAQMGREHGAAAAEREVHPPVVEAAASPSSIHRDGRSSRDNPFGIST